MNLVWRVSFSGTGRNGSILRTPPSRSLGEASVQASTDRYHSRRRAGGHWKYPRRFVESALCWAHSTHLTGFRRSPHILTIFDSGSLTATSALTSKRQARQLLKCVILLTIVQSHKKFQAAVRKFVDEVIAPDAVVSSHPDRHHC